MSKPIPSIDAWLKEAKAHESAPLCGMYLTHNGTVRQTAKAKVRYGAEDTNTFTFRSCRIRLTELPPRGEGIWAVKRIRLHMEGDDADVENIYHRYFMQFLSAGG